MEQQLWINSLREAASKYRKAVPDTLFNPNFCPLCELAANIEEEWDLRCNSCLFRNYKCTKQKSFSKAKEAFWEAKYIGAIDPISEDIEDMLLIRAEELDVLADNIETVPDELFEEWVESFNEE